MMATSLESSLDHLLIHNSANQVWGGLEGRIQFARVTSQTSLPSVLCKDRHGMRKAWVEGIMFSFQ